MLTRGRKYNKPKRGGGRRFNRDLVRGKDGVAESRASRDKNAIAAGPSTPSQQEPARAERREPKKNAIAAGPNTPSQPELTRVERRELKKKRAAQIRAQKQGIDEDDKDADLINPNHVEKKLKISDLGSVQLSQREAEKKAAEERYWQLHLAGKTKQAMSDLARLKKIKEEREVAEVKRKAEAEAKAAEIEAKKAVMSGKRI